jgi:hypothetical protein
VAEGDIVALTDAMEKIGSMQESESKAASDYDAIDSIGKNVTNSSLYGVSKKKEKVKPNLLGPEKTRLKNKMTIFIKEWFTQKGKYEKDTKPQTVVAGAQKKAGKEKAKLSKEEGEKEGGGLLDWISGLLGMLGLGGIGGRRGLMRMLGGWIWKGVKWAGSKIWGGLRAVGSAAWSAIKTGFQGVGSFMSGLWSKFKGSSFWKGFTGAISRGVQAAGNVLSAAKNALQSGLNTVGRTAQSALSSVTGGKIPKPGAARKPPKPRKPSLGARLWGGITKTAGAVKDWGAQKLSQAGKVVGAAKDFVVDKGKKAIEYGGKAVRYVGDKARAGVQFIGDKIKAGKEWLKKTVVGPLKAKLGKYVSGMVRGGGGIMKVLSKFARIPIIGPIIEGFMLKGELGKLQEEYQASQATENPMTPKERDVKAGQMVSKSVGSMAGAALGGIVGSFIPLPFVGTLIGAMGGHWLGGIVGDLIGKHVLTDPLKEKIGQFALRSLAPGAKESPKDPVVQPDPNYVPPEFQEGYNKAAMQDFIVQRGTVIPFSSKDEILGMKKGGAISQLLDEPNQKGFFNRLLGNTNKTMISLFGKTQDTVKSLMSHSRQPKPHTTVDQILSDPFLSAKGNEQEQSARIAELQLKAIGVSNTYLSQLVQLTQALVKKPAGGTGGGSVVSISQPNNSIPPTQGDPQGPSVVSSNVEFYNSAYSMHTPGTLA